MRVGKKTTTIFAVPTTSGTGSEATVAAIISNALTHEKFAMQDPVLVPSYAVLDPKLTLKLPPHITSTTGMDALTHAVEAFIGHSNTRLTRDMAIKAAKLIFENLKRAYDDGTDIEARKNMQIASFYAGVAFTRAYVGNVHAIAHTLGGQYNVPHGLANAVILPHILDFYGKRDYKALSKLADAAGITGASVSEKAKNFIQAIKDMNAYMNIPTNIDKIEEKDIPVMVGRCAKEANPLYPVPIIMSKKEFAEMYREIKG
jgi:alcohol dehydrogenase class IV